MSKYHREVSSTSIDVYDVLVAWDVRNPAIQHAIKKLLQPGNRGHKDTIQDLAEAIQSIERGIVIERNSAKKTAVEAGEWIEWGGGECPVAQDAMVEFKRRDGKVMKRWRARDATWKYGGNLPATNEIVAYRIVKEKAE